MAVKWTRLWVTRHNINNPQDNHSPTPRSMTTPQIPTWTHENQQGNKQQTGVRKESPRIYVGLSWRANPKSDADLRCVLEAREFVFGYLSIKPWWGLHNTLPRCWLPPPWHNLSILFWRLGTGRTLSEVCIWLTLNKPQWGLHNTRSQPSHVSIIY